MFIYQSMKNKSFDGRRNVKYSSNSFFFLCCHALRLMFTYFYSSLNVSDLDEADCLEFLNSQWKEKGMGRATPELLFSFKHSYEKTCVFLSVKKISKLSLD